jgi:adenine-specific DNA-methyltransferase
LGSRIWFGETGDNVPSIKRFLSEVKAGVVPLTIWKHAEVGHNQIGRQEIKKLFENKGFFDGPKPVSVINRALHIANTDSNDIILDFFAGSATTAHAVMQRNAEQDEKSIFIMVQLPEPCARESEAFRSGYKTIADIAKERIRRAAAKIKEEHPEYNGDLGFKVFKLDSTNIKSWEADFDTLDENLLEDYITNIKPGRTESDILYEILLKYGLDLTLPIKEHTIAGQKVFDIGMGALIICLSDAVDLDVVEGIAGLKQELEPEIMRVVFKDSGFADDVVKTNAVQILKQAGIEDVRSL